MTKRWPKFVTKDLGPDDDAEMVRRWRAYDRSMRAIIAKGGVHQDDDGWWVDDATGALIGPDPEIERPASSIDIAGAKPFAQVFPDLAASIKRSRGRPKLENAKQAVTLRLSPDVVEKFKATGDDWRAKMARALERAKV